MIPRTLVLLLLLTGCTGEDLAGRGAWTESDNSSYGKKKVTNVAVVSQFEKLEGRLERNERQLAEARAELEALDAQLGDWQRAEVDLREIRDELTATMGRQLSTTPDGAELAATYSELRRCQAWLDQAMEERTQVQVDIDAARDKVRVHESRRERWRREQEKKAGQTTIFTVDTELDEIMTSYKMTFMNLANRLMREHMDERMELDTLVRSVLTLPGERAVTRTTETIRIFRQPRDPRAMEAVERACASLNAMELTRGEPDDLRLLRLELVDAPERAAESGSG